MVSSAQPHPSILLVSQHKAFSMSGKMTLNSIAINTHQSMPFKPVMKPGPEEPQKSLKVKAISFLKINMDDASQLEGTFIFKGGECRTACFSLCFLCVFFSVCFSSHRTSGLACSFDKFRFSLSRLKVERPHSKSSLPSLSMDSLSFLRRFQRILAWKTTPESKYCVLLVLKCPQL